MRPRLSYSKAVWIPALSRLAEIKVVEGPAKVQREWGQRRVVIQCNVEGRDVGGFVDEARARVEKEVKLPAGRYRLEWGGKYENLQRAQARLTVVVPVALGLIFLLLYITYRHLTDVVLVFTSIVDTEPLRALATKAVTTNK